MPSLENKISRWLVGHHSKVKLGVLLIDLVSSDLDIELSLASVVSDLLTDS
ncbi:hypothetical protein PanWU01x14_207780, partial [Parasponia andersonii]